MTEISIVDKTTPVPGQKSLTPVASRGNRYESRLRQHKHADKEIIRILSTAFKFTALGQLKSLTFRTKKTGKLPYNYF